MEVLKKKEKEEEKKSGRLLKAYLDLTRSIDIFHYDVESEESYFFLDYIFYKYKYLLLWNHDNVKQILIKISGSKRKDQIEFQV